MDCSLFAADGYPGCIVAGIVSELEAFLEWCKLKGHYSAREALERWLKIQDTKKPPG
ncbi:unnamed protein product [marine sediment metagenome]|uniref:Uncharacterized protein n=1 Tax=marine sediment metagenome TaxID=412755 RepID=X0XHV1_9ZZZZ